MTQTQIQRTTNRTSRMIVINHPNSFDAICFKRIFLNANNSNQIAGISLLGNENDNDEVDYQEKGMVKVLFVDPWQSSKIINNNINANDIRVKITALIEPDIEGLFELEKGDLFYLCINQQISLAYEIVGIELPIGLPDRLNARRYELIKRDDLDYIETLPSDND